MSTGTALAFPRGESEEDAYSADIFRQADPRGYHRVMFDLNYGLPDAASVIYRQIIRALGQRLQRRVRVLELGCGFGVLSALIRHPLDMNELAHRCRDLDWAEIGDERIFELDKNFYASWPNLIEIDMVGWDVHVDALSYARHVGLIDYAVSSNFETDDLSEADSEILSGVDLVISLNCADFMSAEVFEKVLSACGPTPPWCAVFAVRGSNYFMLQSACQEHGLINEKLQGLTVVQRRFSSSSEWTQVLLNLENQGIATAGKEADGLLHSEFHLSRPSADIMDLPLARLVNLSHSEASDFGGWRRRPWGV